MIVAVRLIDGADRDAAEIDGRAADAPVDDGRIAALPLEGIGEALLQQIERLRAAHSPPPARRGRGRAAADRRCRGNGRHGRGSRSPPRSSPTPASSNCSRRSGLVSTRIRVLAIARPGSRRGGGGCAARRGRTRPSRCRSAARPRRCRSRGCGPSRRGLGEQAAEIGAGRLGQRLERSRRAARRGSARCRRRRPARTGLPRCGTGARNGRIGLDQQPVERDRLGRLLQVARHS